MRKNQFFYVLGILASAKRTSLHLEHNEEQGAWGSEGRIHCYSDLPLFRPYFKITAGRGDVLGRINCNEYVEELAETYNFSLGRQQDATLIESSVPVQYKADFRRGMAV